jgi:3-deoxy-D-manno-octulosonate 8-phosphate phosphatase (KDO 8-P phosphatase)
MDNYRTALDKINTFIFDIDGVLTDGNVIVASDGEQLRTMNVRDGYALQLAVKKGYRILIISGGKSETMKQRFLGLGITDIFLGINNKFEVYQNYVNQKNLNKENILYMGDDIPDYEVMSIVGFAACPADASEEIKSISKYISPRKGGDGCVRDIIEQVLKIHAKWLDKDSFHW